MYRDNRMTVAWSHLCLLMTFLFISSHYLEAQVQPASVTLAVPQPTVIQGTAVPMYAAVTSGQMAPIGSVSFTDGLTVLQTQPLFARSSTNLLPYSSDGNKWMASGSGWIVPASVPAPDGTVSGFTLEFTGSADTSIVQSVAISDPLKPYIFSVWLKTTTGTIATNISLQDATGANAPRQVLVTSMWQRFSLVASLSYQAKELQVIIGGSGTLGPSLPAGDIQVWGAQVEESLPGPYVETNGASVKSGSAENIFPYSVAGDKWIVNGDGTTYDPSDSQYIPNIDPDGTFFTSRFQYQGDIPTSLTYGIPTLVGDPRYVFSVWLRIPKMQPELDTSIFVLNSNSVVSQQAVHISHSWKRFFVAANLLGASSITVGVGGDSTLGPNVPQGQIDFWGAQLDQGVTVPGPYVVTHSAARSETVSNLLSNSNGLSDWVVGGTGMLTASTHPDPYGNNSAIAAFYSSMQDTTLTKTIGTTDLTKPHKFSVWLRSTNDSFNTYIALFDQNGSEVSVPVSLTADWRRFSVTGYLPAAANVLKIGIGAVLAGAQCPMGDGTTGSFEIFGSQVELVKPGGYVPTNGTSVSGSVGLATFATSTLSPGTHSITAVYNGDPYSNAATSNAVQVTVDGTGSAAAQQMSLYCLPALVVVGQGFDCTAQMLAGTVGQIAYSIDGAQWTAAAIGVSGVSTVGQTATTLVPGLHQVTAVYTGASGGTTQTISLAVLAPDGQGAANSNLVYSYSIPTGGYDEVGNITSYNDSINGSWLLGYDQLNRLNTAVVTLPFAAPVDMGWTYDSFGNRLTQTGGVTATWANYDNNNQISGTPSLPVGIPPSAGTSPSNGMYDESGNLINDGGNFYVYDAEGRLCASQRYFYITGLGPATGYLYDADGSRIAKGSLTVPQGVPLACPGSFPSAAFQVTTTYVGGVSGVSMAEFDSEVNLTRSYIYDAQGLLASQDSAGTHLNLRDWLGTRRVQVDLNASQEASFRNAPFGDGFTQSGVDDASQQFTGKERDAESGNDYFGARYYGSSMGRFMSPDWGSVMGDSIPDPVPYADFTNPQSLNLYTYGYNNPLSNKDADGHDVNVCTTGSNGSQSCTLMSNSQYQAASQGNGSLNVPSLNQVGMNGNGSGQFNATNITDGNGNSVGTATYVSNGGADYYANRTGIDFINTQTAPVVNTMAGITIGAVGLIGGAEIAAAAPEAGGLIQQAGAYRRFLSLRSAWTALSKATGAAGLIGTFFKTGQVPPGLTPEMMQSYLSLARAYIAAGLGGAAGLAEQTSRAEQLSQYLGK